MGVPAVYVESWIHLLSTCSIFNPFRIDIQQFLYVVIEATSPLLPFLIRNQLFFLSGAYQYVLSVVKDPLFLITCPSGVIFNPWLSPVINC